MKVLDLQENPPYQQELKFGELMLKRAGRELARLRREIEQPDSAADIAVLKTRYEKLCTEIESFEVELRSYQAQVTEGNWSAS